MIKSKLIVLAVSSLILAISCIPSGRDYGKEMYEEKCANCHGIEGDGLQQLFPPLKGSDYLVENQADLACMIRFGMKGEIEVNGVKYNQDMPGQPLLTEIDIHNIINYIAENINKDVKKVKLNEVSDRIIDCNPE